MENQDIKIIFYWSHIIFSSLKMFVNKQFTNNLRSHPRLNPLPLRNKQKSPEHLLHSHKTHDVRTSNNACSSPLNKDQSCKGGTFKPQYLDHIVKENQQYFTDKLFCENKAMPSKFKIKYPNCQSQTIYNREFRVPEQLMVLQPTFRKSQRNISNFDEGYQGSVDSSTIYQQEFSPKRQQRLKLTKQQKEEQDTQYPYSQLTSYSNSFVNWRSKSHNISLQTKPYSLIRNLPFGNTSSNYQQSFKDKENTKRERKIPDRKTLGPKISNKLQLSPLIIQKQPILRKRHYLKHSLDLMNRNNMQTLSSPKVGLKDQSNSQYKSSYDFVPINKQIKPTIQLHQLQQLIRKI